MPSGPPPSPQPLSSKPMLGQKVKRDLKSRRGVVVHRQGVARVGLQVDLDVGGVGEDLVLLRDAVQTSAVPAADVKVLFRQHVMDGALERTRGPQQLVPAGDLGDGDGLLERVAQVELRLREVAREEQVLDPDLFAQDVAGRPVGRAPDGPRRVPDGPEVPVQDEPGDDGALGELRVGRDEGRGEERPVAVADVHRLVGCGADARHRGQGPVARQRGQLPEDLELQRRLDPRVGVRVVRPARAQAVVREDGVPGVERGVDVRVARGVGVPVSPVVVGPVRGDLQHAPAARRGRAQSAVDVVRPRDGDVLEHQLVARRGAPGAALDGPRRRVEVGVDRAKVVPGPRRAGGDRDVELLAHGRRRRRTSCRCVRHRRRPHRAPVAVDEEKNRRGEKSSHVDVEAVVVSVWIVIVQLVIRGGSKGEVLYRPVKLTRTAHGDELIVVPSTASYLMQLRIVLRVRRHMAA